MKKLIILMLFLAGCAAQCPGACFEGVAKEAGEKSVVRKFGDADRYYVKKENGEIWIFRTNKFNSCEVSGKERIF
jgi:hypothetical protein